MVTCAGSTKKGDKCTREAVSGSRYCWQHGESTLPAQGSFRDLLDWTAAELGQENADRLESYFQAFHPNETEKFVARALSKPDKSRRDFVRRFVEEETEDEIEDTFEALAPRIDFDDALAAAAKNDTVMLLLLYKAFLLHFNAMTGEQRFDVYTRKLGLDISALQALSYRDREDVIYNAFKAWVSDLPALYFEVLVRGLFDDEDKLITVANPDFYQLLP